mgnify:CR=1 FL=1
MTMEELVKRMDESFNELRKVHNLEEAERVWVDTINSLLHKIEERDATIVHLRAEIKRLTEEYNRAINYS